MNSTSKRCLRFWKEVSFLVFNSVWVTSVAAEAFVDTQTLRQRERGKKRRKNCTSKMRNLTDHGWLKKDKKRVEGDKKGKEEREAKIRAPSPASLWYSSIWGTFLCDFHLLLSLLHTAGYNIKK